MEFLKRIPHLQAEYQTQNLANATVRSLSKALKRVSVTLLSSIGQKRASTISNQQVKWVRKLSPPLLKMPIFE